MLDPGEVLDALQLRRLLPRDLEKRTTLMKYFARGGQQSMSQASGQWVPLSDHPEAVDRIVRRFRCAWPEGKEAFKNLTPMQVGYWVATQAYVETPAISMQELIRLLRDDGMLSVGDEISSSDGGDDPNATVTYKNMWSCGDVVDLRWGHPPFTATVVRRGVDTVDLHRDPWTEYDLGPKQLTLAPLPVYAVGNDVCGNFQGLGSWWPARVTDRHGDDTYDLSYDRVWYVELPATSLRRWKKAPKKAKATEEELTGDASEKSKARRHYNPVDVDELADPAPFSWKVGDEVEAHTAVCGKTGWHPCIITDIVNDVHKVQLWSTDYWTESHVARERVRPPIRFNAGTAVELWLQAATPINSAEMAALPAGAVRLLRLPGKIVEVAPGGKTCDVAVEAGCDLKGVPWQQVVQSTAVLPPPQPEDPSQGRADEQRLLRPTLVGHDQVGIARRLKARREEDRKKRIEQARVDARRSMARAARDAAKRAAKGKNSDDDLPPSSGGLGDRQARLRRLRRSDREVVDDEGELLQQDPGACAKLQDQEHARERISRAAQVHSGRRELPEERLATMQAEKEAAWRATTFKRNRAQNQRTRERARGAARDHKVALARVDSKPAP